MAKRLKPEAFEDVDLLTESGNVIDSLHLRMRDVINDSEVSKERLRNHRDDQTEQPMIESPAPNRIIRVDSVGDEISDRSGKKSQRHFHAEMRSNKALADTILTGVVSSPDVPAATAAPLDLSYKQRLANTEVKRQREQDGGSYAEQPANRQKVLNLERKLMGGGYHKTPKRLTGEL